MQDLTPEPEPHNHHHKECDMDFNRNAHHRRSIRLRHYNYSKSGLYFVTICTHGRLPLFGNIVAGEMILNRAGLAVETCWRNIANHFTWINADEFVVMPSHVHGIVNICARDGGEPQAVEKDILPLQHGASCTIGSVVRGFKVGVTKWFRKNTDIHQVWQRNYHEHIIRNEESYLKIVEYIQTNPQRWTEDRYHAPLSRPVTP